MSDNKKKPPLSSDDFDKTLVDVDVRKLEAEDLEKTQIIGRKKPVEPAVSQAPVAKAPPAKEKNKPEKIEKSEVIVKTPSPSVSEASKPEKQWSWKENFVALVVWFFLTLFQVSFLIDALASASPLRLVLGLGLILNILFCAFCYIRKLSFQYATHFAGAIVLLTLSYSTYKYGSLNNIVLTSFKKTPAYLFNFIFLVSIIYFQITLLKSKKYSSAIKIVISLAFLLYPLFGILENLIYASWLLRNFWSLQDNLRGSFLLFLPFYLKPILLYFYFILPLIFLGSLFKLLKSKS